MNSTQKTHKSKLQLLAVKNTSTNLPKNYQKTEQNKEQNLDLTDKIKNFNWQNNLENSNIKFTFGQNIPHNSAQKFIQTPNSTLHQKVSTPIDLVDLSDLQNLQKKLNELKNDKTKLQLEIQNLQTKIQTQVQNEAQKQTILHQKIAKQNWQNWQIDKQNQQLFTQFAKSQSDKLEILKQRVFWQKITN